LKTDEPLNITLGELDFIGDHAEQHDFDDDVVIARQPRTMVYVNPNGQAVIRQDADEFGENDPFVFPWSTSRRSSPRSARRRRSSPRR
jgi:hypothetical protein